MKLCFSEIINIKNVSIFLILWLNGLASINSQIANFVSNGGLEKRYTCNINDPNATYVVNAIDWFGLGTYAADKYCVYCTGNVPYNSFFYNYPRSDSAYVIFDVLAPNNIRTYVRNKLKSNLVSGKSYCVKYYVNLSEYSAYSINKIGAYFGSDALDTIKKGQVALQYLIPQIEPPVNSFPLDTIGWTLITGTYTATGIEKYIVIGNFRVNIGTDTLPNNLSPSVRQWSACTIGLDDVSCIPLDLPAFAGNDTTCVPGTPVYLGRTRDVGIDEACTWYKLPIVITPTTPALDTAAGIWVSPTQTSTYVVKQDICGVIKFDTVVVYKDAVGLNKLKIKNLELKISPSPVQEYITITSFEPTERAAFSIIDVSGKVVLYGDFKFSGNEFTLPIDLENGIYVVRFVTDTGVRETKKIVVMK
jgi:hypothetical protein